MRPWISVLFTEPGILCTLIFYVRSRSQYGGLRGQFKWKRVEPSIDSGHNRLRGQDPYCTFMFRISDDFQCVVALSWLSPPQQRRLAARCQWRLTPTSHDHEHIRILCSIYLCYDWSLFDPFIESVTNSRMFSYGTVHPPASSRITSQVPFSDD